MKEFGPLIGEWHGEGEIPVDPPMKISEEAKIERLGEFIVFGAVGEPADRARQHLDHRRRARR